MSVVVSSLHAAFLRHLLLAEQGIEKDVKEPHLIGLMYDLGLDDRAGTYAAIEPVAQLVYVGLVASGRDGCLGTRHFRLTRLGRTLAQGGIPADGDTMLDAWAGSVQIQTFEQALMQIGGTQTA